MQNEHLLSLPFYLGLERDFHNYLPHCTAKIDSSRLRYAMNYAHSGRIFWEMEGHERRILAAPITWWTVPDVHYAYGALDGESWEHRFISFEGSRAQLYCEGGLLPSDLSSPHYAPVLDPQNMCGLWDDLFYWLDAPAPDGTARSWSDARSTLALERLLIYVQSQQKAPLTLTPTQEVIVKWSNAIRHAPQKEWSMAQAAQELGFSEGHLRRVFKAHTGVAPAQFVIQCRLEVAAALLKTNAEPISSVAYKAGFDDLAHFSRLFRRRYGLPPSRYRREAQLV